jgi:hypothetical protein
MSAGDDAYLDSTTETYGGEWGDLLTITTTPGSIEVYVRFFNSSDPTTATHYVDDLRGEQPYTIDATAIVSYNGLGGSPAGDDWVLVPEPTSLALFGVGLAVMAARKRFAKQ